MREIKFKIWHAEKSVMLMPEGIINLEGETSRRLKENDPSAILLQYTGLKDKAKNPIYEGDIVELEVDFQGSPPDGEDGFHVKHTGFVKYTPSRGFHIVITKSWDLDNLEAVTHPEIKNIVGYRSEVIGNVHQHPNLLTE